MKYLINKALNVTKNIKLSYINFSKVLSHKKFYFIGTVTLAFRSFFLSFLASDWHSRLHINGILSCKLGFICHNRPSLRISHPQIIWYLSYFIVRKLPSCLNFKRNWGFSWNVAKTFANFQWGRGRFLPDFFNIGKFYQTFVKRLVQSDVQNFQRTI